MDNPSNPLLLRVYAGRENGLMIVGDRTSLSALAMQLQAAVDSPPNAPLASWPAVVANPPVLGPYKDIQDFKLSFHLEGSSPLEQVIPLRRRGPPFLFLVVVAILAVTGIISIARWALAL
jgi:hypothetical protein